MSFNGLQQICNVIVYILRKGVIKLHICMFPGALCLWPEETATDVWRSRYCVSNCWHWSHRSWWKVTIFPQHLEWYIKKKNYPWNFNVKFSFFFVSSRNQEIVYGMDKNGDILGIKFWGGLKVCVCADISQTK